MQNIEELKKYVEEFFKPYEYIQILNAYRQGDGIVVVILWDKYRATLPFYVGVYKYGLEHRFRYAIGFSEESDINKNLNAALAIVLEEHQSALEIESSGKTFMEDVESLLSKSVADGEITQTEKERRIALTMQAIAA